MTHTRQASVAAVVLSDGSGGLDATLTAIDQQVYELASVVLVGAAADASAAANGTGSIARETVDQAVEAIGTSVEYLWFVAEGATPRPDALAAAARDAERTDAGVIGSKILRPDGGLISVGVITDAFGVPYSGLDSSERDQGQHDVVRDVAAVPRPAFLMRRDLFHGLGGFDSVMAPRAAAIDIAQRARQKGARVVVSPASEVIFEPEAHEAVRWKEEATRIRAVIKAYGLLTLLWVLPLEFVLGLTEVVVSIFLGKWYGFDFVKAWAWNLIHVIDTFAVRHRSRSGAVTRDEELFRYQRKGSVKLSRLTSASMSALRSRLPGDDRFSVEAIGDEIKQPAFVVGILAVLFVLVAARNLWSGGFPAVGYTLPFPANGSDVLSAYAGGWNPAGLGSPEPLRPLIAIAGFAKLVTLNAASFSEYLLGAGAMLSGIWGMMRLLRTWSIAAAPGLIAGIVYVAGPAAQGIGGNTHLGALLALGVLPWALRFVLKPTHGDSWALVARFASVILVFGLLGAFSPLFLLIPIPVVGLYALIRFSDGDAWRSFILSLVGTAGGVLLLSPWIWSASILGIARSGYAFWHVPFVASIAGAVVVVAAVLAAKRPLGLIAGWAALVGGLGLAVSRSGDFGFGTETESMGLAALGLGVAAVVGIVGQSVAARDAGGWRRFVMGIGSVGILVLVVTSLTIVLGGRVGLPGDRFTSGFEFTRATEGQAEISRILVVGPRHLLPGDSRTIDGGAYRVVSAPVPDLGEVRLADSLEFDDHLRDTMDMIVTGETKRAGAELAVFGIRWIVVMGDGRGSDASEASRAWRDVFAGQLDLLPLTAAIGNTVFATDIHPVGRALTTAGTPWSRSGWEFSGEPEPGRRLFLAENPDDGWGPGPRITTESMNEISAESGEVVYAPDQGRRTQAVLVLLALVVLIVVSMWGRTRP